MSDYLVKLVAAAAIAGASLFTVAPAVAQGLCEGYASQLVTAPQTQAPPGTTASTTATPTASGS